MDTRVTIEHGGMTASVSCGQNWGESIYEVGEMIKGALVGVGFTPQTVAELFRGDIEEGE